MNLGVFVFVATRSERIWLLYVPRESQILSILLGQKGSHFDPLICLEEVELVHGRTLEVGTSYMVLILVADIENTLVRGKKILALIERVQVLLQLIKRVQRRIR